MPVVTSLHNHDVRVGNDNVEDLLLLLEGGSDCVQQVLNAIRWRHTRLLLLLWLVGCRLGVLRHGGLLFGVGGAGSS